MESAKVDSFCPYLALDAKLPRRRYSTRLINEYGHQRPAASSRLFLRSDYITPQPKGATLSGLSDLGVSKEGADFLGTPFGSLQEAGDWIFELGLVGGHSLTGKVCLRSLVMYCIACRLSILPSRWSSKHPDSIPGCKKVDHAPRSRACFPAAILSPVGRDGLANCRQ